jgi:hypothetical protein
MNEREKLNVAYFTVAMSCRFAAFLISSFTLASSLSIPSNKNSMKQKLLQYLEIEIQFFG